MSIVASPEADASVMKNDWLVIMKSLRLTGMMLMLSLLVTAQQGAWRSLFNGKNLDGWKRLGGTATYAVEEGMIVGRTVADSRNTFLCTKEEFGDFILELEVYVEDEEGNSGIQTRSHFDPAGYSGEGKVYGRQCEVDPSFRRWTGGIYDEGRRDWLYPMQLNAGAQHLYRPGVFNHFRVECIGNEMRTWVNGSAAACVVDTIDSKGFIGLQVHAINSPDHAGRKVCFRNIRIQTKNLVRKPFPPGIFVFNLVPNSLSPYQQQNGWKLLFDGKSLQGWHRAAGTGVPDHGWEIAGGVLTVLASSSESARGGDLVTNQRFRAFDLSFEFKLGPGGNSGLKYFVRLPEKPGTGAIGLEYQLLDDTLHPDAKMGREGNRTLGSLYDLIKADKQKRFLRPIGEWNTGRIVVYPNEKVEHYLNGVKVLEYIRGSKDYLDLVAKSKYAGYPHFGEDYDGPLLLQDHGDRVSFRSLRIRELH